MLERGQDCVAKGIVLSCAAGTPSIPAGAYETLRLGQADGGLRIGPTARPSHSAGPSGQMEEGIEP